MRLAIAQINTRIGDFRANLDRLERAVDEALLGGADLVVAPELAVCGYPPRDLLYRADFVQATLEATEELARRLQGGPALLVGSLLRAESAPPGHPGLYNAAVLLREGRIADRRAKRQLPSFDVFHESRWFVPGPSPKLLPWRSTSLGVLICEDLWHESPLTGQADCLLALSASPYRRGIEARRLEVARRPGRPLVYVNAVGAHDELIFDGGSFALDAEGRIVAALPRFQEGVVVLPELAGRPALSPGQPLDPTEEVFEALVLGIRDFLAKNGLQRVVLGLSGGVDSALVACLAREALGPERVLALALPSRYTDPRSTESARQLAHGLGIGFREISLEQLHQAAEETLGELPGSAAENVQARLRALILLAEVNRGGGVLLNTSNKTELTLGYGTLHGDLAGTLSPLGDLTKLEVYELARWYARESGLLPAFILERPPTAELRPLQVDPFDYPRVAPQAEALIASGGTNAAEFKRREFGIILKVSEKAFGSGRMMPVTWAGFLQTRASAPVACAGA